MADHVSEPKPEHVPSYCVASGKDEDNNYKPHVSVQNKNKMGDLNQNNLGKIK